MERLNDLQERYQRLVGAEARQVQSIRSMEADIASMEAYGQALVQAQEVVRELANQARQDFKQEVDGLVTLAVRSVFTEDFSFDLQMTTDGGRLQCRPVVWETIGDVQVEYTPKDDMGGSVLDPIGFALRVVLQQFQRNPTRALFLLDEPMKNTGHGELLTQAGRMLAEISHSVGLQLVIITHEPELAECADRAWRVTRTQGKSTAVIIKGGTGNGITKAPARPGSKRKLIK